MDTALVTENRKSVSNKDIHKLLGLQMTLVEESNATKVLEGIVAYTPKDERRANYCLVHRAHEDKPFYTNLYPKEIVNIDLNEAMIVIATPTVIGGGGYYKPYEAQVASMLLDQHRL